MKINVDATVPRHAKYGAVGAICRSEDGTFMGASVLVLKYISSPQILEALAIREAMALAEDLYQRRIHVVSDCKQVVEDLNEENASTHGAIVHEIIHQSSDFDFCKFSHEFRSSNVEAHNLEVAAVCG